MFSSRNVKGSKIDFQMQHDCYPFTLYNVMAFWGILSFQSEDQFRRKVYQPMGEKIRLASLMLREHLEGKTRSRISQLLGKETE